MNLTGHLERIVVGTHRDAEAFGPQITPRKRLHHKTPYVLGNRLSKTGVRTEPKESSPVLLDRISLALRKAPDPLASQKFGGEIPDCFAQMRSTYRSELKDTFLATRIHSFELEGGARHPRRRAPARDRYLAIEQVRFGERLVVERAIDPAAMPCALPPLLLQPRLVRTRSRWRGRPHRGRHAQDRGRAARRAARGHADYPVDDDAAVRPGEGLGLDIVRRRCWSSAPTTRASW